jgi:phage shock protein A
MREAAMRSRVLLKEFQIRALLGRAATLAHELDADPGLLDELAAEEHRIYERAMEREQRLLHLEETIEALERSVGRLASAIEGIGPRQAAGEVEPIRLAG